MLQTWPSEGFRSWINQAKTTNWHDMTEPLVSGACFRPFGNVEKAAAEGCRVSWMQGAEEVRDC